MAAMKYRVEGLPYPSKELANVVAQRFARRYGRDIAVCNDKGKVLYYVAQNGRHTG